MVNQNNMSHLDCETKYTVHVCRAFKVMRVSLVNARQKTFIPTISVDGWIADRFRAFTTTAVNLSLIDKIKNARVPYLVLSE